MIMKRLMALIALASSAALAQQQPGDGNVPAPDLFDDQIQCSNRLPSMVPTPSVGAGEEGSQLDALIENGEIPYADDGGSYPGAEALLYIIPATEPDCGAGTVGDADFNRIDDNDFSAMDGAVHDVAKVYSETYAAFRTMLAAEDDVQVRRQRLDSELRLATETNPNTANIAMAEDALEAAETSLAEAQTELGTVGAGPISQAGIAEWRASLAVDAARRAWNSAVAGIENSKSELDGAVYADYIDLPDKRINTLRNQNGTINYGNLVNYISFNRQGLSDIDNFDDDTNNLVVPMHDHDNNPDTPEVPEPSPMSIGEIRMHIETVNEVVKALEEAAAANTNPLRTNIYGEGLRRAMLEQAHWQEQWRQALADDTDLEPNTDGEQSIRALYGEYQDSVVDRGVAETALRNAVAARETATQNVVDEFHNAQSFYAQLVDRRQKLSDQAEATLVEAGDSATQAQTDAAAAAATALADAEQLQDRYLAMVEDPQGPIVDLVDTLLETDGDDGQALVDAITETWVKTGQNENAIGALTADTEDGAEMDGPITANRKSIDALTADTEDGAEADGPIAANRKSIDSLTADTENGAEADGPITANRKAIEANDEEIESLGGRVTQNEADIDTLMEDTEMNAAMISSNSGHIVSNSGHIASNASNIATNASNIVANTGHIGRNSGNIAMNGARIDRNAGHIALNGERIGANAAAIGMNSGLIADNRHLIGELSSDLAVVRAGVAASIALSRMPSIDGGGISFGAGTFAGEMAYAVGFQVERGFGSFDIGVTSSGGEIGAGVGVGLKVWH